eukprot:CAMPEP_0204481990 /NCGR_PEP_ID=MMETSP0471-20130131/49343_1 /ASSEMBLY_ACC=CAM_ASM_000602 /TAXON_ID=2969 /ORGANISM="Oxyrrhis marina" /LENGTH=207 /DNA_ID=CAMNT_0051485215 /DNA_START=141 /DNA_END=764 /DNA_ORIENTATION=+
MGKQVGGFTRPIKQVVNGVQSKPMSYLARHNRNRLLTPFANRLFANDFWHDFDLNLPRSPSAWMKPEMDRVGRVGGFSLGAVDVHEDEKGWVVAVDTPGMTDSDVKVQSHQNIITISGERKTEQKDEETGHFERSFGKFSRSFQLGDNANIKDVSATLDNGVLRIAIPKIESLPNVPQIQDIPITLAPSSPPKQEQLSEDLEADKKD